jgi:hypothetical protein
MSQQQWFETAAQEEEYNAWLDEIERANDEAEYEHDRIRDEEMIKQWEDCNECAS